MRTFRALVAVAGLVLAATAVAGIGTALAQEASPSPGSVISGECIGCHAHPEIQIADDGEYRPDLYVRPEDLAGSMHEGFVCTDCHSTLRSTMHAKKDAARDSCHTCHEEQFEAYEAGFHGSSGEGPRPTCITCHGSHQVQDANTRDFVHRAAEQCARCHEQMNERFMGGNAFGMETHLAGEDVATCADCHGYHTVLPTEDERSPVNEANILTTCRGCHANAPDNFVDVQMHVARGPIPDDPRLRVITIWMLTLLIGTFGFFGYLTALGIRHEWRRQLEKARQRPDAGGVL